MINKNDLRISAGKFKNIKLKVNEQTTRPVRERVKLAVFSIIQDKIADAECLDLYAGSGNLGLEAYSRGASKVDFIEIDRLTADLIKENIVNISQKFTDQVGEADLKVIRKDALDYVANELAHYDIIFADPPYLTQTNHLLKNIDRLMKKDGIFIYFHDKNQKVKAEELNDRLKTTDQRNYGITIVDFIALL